MRFNGNAKKTKEENLNRIERNKISTNIQGITLIALVVTIIVLIILAGVSINLVLGDNGIITRAKKGKENYQIAANEERQELANIEVSIDSIIDGTSITQISISSLKAGDYIKYNTGVDGVGEMMCRVLYNDSTNGLQIISDKNIKQTIDGVEKEIKVTLGNNDWETGKSAYNSSIEILNNEAEKYLNKEYAADARCVGSLPSVDDNGSFTEKDKGTETTVSISSDWTIPTGWLTTDTGCYDSDVNYNTDVKAMGAASISTIGEDYWLASRTVRLNSSSCGFRVRGVYASGLLFNFNLCVISSDGSISGSSYSYGLRPCFSIKSDIKITGGDGASEETAYTL